MAVPMLSIILAAASVGGGFDGAQNAYNRCLATEMEMALSKRIDAVAFRAGAPRVCEEETAVYRRMAVASMVGQGMAGASSDAANRRFDAFDRSNRAELVNSFEKRLKLRRGPARVAGLPTAQPTQQD